MNKKVIIVLLIASIVLITAFSLARKNVFKRGTLLIESKELSEMLKDEDDKNILKVTVNLPNVVSDLEQDENEIEFINDYMDEYYFSYIKRTKEEIYPMAKENMEYVTEEDFVYEASNGYTVKRNDDKILSLEMTDFVYAGGAHGSHNVEGINFDLRNLKEIKFADLFSVPKELYEKTLYDIVDKDIKESIEKDNAFFLDGYEDSIKVAFDDGRFILSDKSLILIYEEYDITAYAEGTKYIEIPYSEIKNIMNKEYIN